MQEKVKQLLDEHGLTYAEAAGIKLADEPSPLYQLLVLTVLLAHPIQANVAVAASQALSKAGLKTPRKMLDATWQERVDALGKGHYVRYDESTATALGDGAKLLLDKYDGDLRKLHEAAGGDVDRLRKLLDEVPRIGPTGADIFCREAQAVWPDLRPFLDKRALQGASKWGLPSDAVRLASLVPDEKSANLAAALVRASLGS
jgi:co-chaperonin GroES (HSP10)